MKKIILLICLSVAIISGANAQDCSNMATLTPIINCNTVTFEIRVSDAVLGEPSFYQARLHFGDGSPSVFFDDVSGMVTATHEYDAAGGDFSPFVEVKAWWPNGERCDFVTFEIDIFVPDCSVECRGSISVGKRCAGEPSDVHIYADYELGDGKGYTTFDVSIDFGDGTTQTMSGDYFEVIDHTFPSQTEFMKTYEIVADFVVYDNEGNFACTDQKTWSHDVYNCNINTTCNDVNFENGVDDWSFRITSGSDDQTYHELIPETTALDPYAGFPITPNNGGTVLKLGNDNHNYAVYQANIYYNGPPITEKKVGIRFAGVFEDVQNTDMISNSPRFEILTFPSETASGCNYNRIDLDWMKHVQTVPGTDISYIPWTTFWVDLSEYYGRTSYEFQFNVYKSNANSSDPEVDFAYMYFDVICGSEFEGSDGFSATVDACSNRPATLTVPFETGFGDGDEFTWEMGDGTVYYDEKEVTHTYTQPGSYVVTITYNPPYFPKSPGDEEPDVTSFTDGKRWDTNLTDVLLQNPEIVDRLTEYLDGRDVVSIVDVPRRCGATVVTIQVNVTDCSAPPFDCESCIPPFAPVPGEKYVLSAWTKKGTGIGYTTYEGPSIMVSFLDGSLENFTPSGPIIDGWQRIVGEFVVPDEADQIWITLRNDGENMEVFFDDIRVQPFNSSLKAFVYDPVNLRLVAEMDERNFATFFEYDEEGGLVRVKKETERGVKTISESRSSMRKR